MTTGGRAFVQPDGFVSSEPNKERIMDNENERLLTLGEAARFLSVSKISLRRWTARNELACVRMGRRKDRRFRLNDLADFVYSHTSKAHASFRADGICSETEQTLCQAPLKAERFVDGQTLGD
jgi:excisionase family DNA binding protein